MRRAALVVVLAALQTGMCLGSATPQPLLLKMAAHVARHSSRQRASPGTEAARSDGPVAEPFWLSVASFVAHELQEYARSAATLCFAQAAAQCLALGLAAVCDWSLKDLTAVKDFCVACLDAEGLILICGFFSYAILISQALSPSSRVYYYAVDDGRHGHDSWRRYCLGMREYREHVAERTRREKRRAYHRRRRFFGAKNHIFEVGRECPLRVYHAVHATSLAPDSQVGFDLVDARRKPCDSFRPYRRRSDRQRTSRLFASRFRRRHRCSHHELFLKNGTRVSIAASDATTVAQLEQEMYAQYEALQHEAATRMQARWRGVACRARACWEEKDGSPSTPSVSSCEVEDGTSLRCDTLQNAAATRVQARWRGVTCRADMRSQSRDESSGGSHCVEEDISCPCESCCEEENGSQQCNALQYAAATRVQARWRGVACRANMCSQGCDESGGTGCAEEGSVWWRCSKKCCASNCGAHLRGGGDTAPVFINDDMKETVDRKKWIPTPAGDTSKRWFKVKAHGEKGWFPMERLRAKGVERDPLGIERHLRNVQESAWMTKFKKKVREKNDAIKKAEKKAGPEGDRIKKHKAEQKQQNREKAKAAADNEQPREESPEAPKEEAKKPMYRQEVRSVPGESEAQRSERRKKELGTQRERQQDAREHDLNRAAAARRYAALTAASLAADTIAADELAALVTAATLAAAFAC